MRGAWHIGIRRLVWYMYKLIECSLRGKTNTHVNLVLHNMTKCGWAVFEVSELHWDKGGGRAT